MSGHSARAGTWRPHLTRVRTRAVRVCKAAVLIALAAGYSGCNSAADESANKASSESTKAAPGTAQSKSGAEQGARPRDPRSPDDTVDGYRVIKARTKSGEPTAIRVKPPKGWEIAPAPSEPDPHAGKFTLAEALEGLPKRGELAAHIKTGMGSFYCDLFETKAPVTVANFVGLARGLRKFWDGEKLAWVARPYYDGTTFHRVIPGFMIQGGDHTGTGRGGIGYQLDDELDPGLHHDRAGQLCMANRGKNTNEAQFFITEARAAHLDGSYTIFGQCEPAALVQRIARVPQSGAPLNKPLTAVTIERVEIRRVAGGAAKWMPASAKLPPLSGAAPLGRAVEIK
jgi:peptidyl-prolyl cis-trans isomerase A (cyclophilin A)